MVSSIIDSSIIFLKNSGYYFTKNGIECKDSVLVFSLVEQSSNPSGFL